MSHHIQIDTSQVPEDKLNHPDFKSLYAKIEKALGDQGWRHAFSIHETGHWIYLQRAGLRDFLFFGPAIRFNPMTNEFDGYPASIQPQIGSVTPDNSNLGHWIFDVAKGFAAGGVFSRQLTGAPDAGDEEDYQHFEAICTLILEIAPDAPLERGTLWREAQEDIKKELQSPAFRKEAWEKAGEIREKIFGRR